MKKIALFFLLSVLWISACKEDDPPAGPSLSISSAIDLTQAVCLGIPFQITVSLSTDASIGIESFTIVKNGTETVVEETNIVANLFTYTFNYAATQADLSSGLVEFTFTLNDKNGDVATEVLQLQVVTEFAFEQALMEPDPSWDLVKNEAVSNPDGSNVDIFLTTESEGCGFGCIHYRFTFTSKNDTRFYSVPLNTIVSPYNNTLKQTELLEIIDGINPQSELVVFSDFQEDITSMGSLNNMPVVAQIRGTDEYALIEKLSPSGGFFYKKRTADAGGN